MAKHRERQYLIKQYREETKITDVDMHNVVKWAVEKGLLKLPKPKDPYDILAKQLSDSAREETRTDMKTGQLYRVNHAYPESHGGHLWIDIDHDSATREKMQKSLGLRRNQMVGDGVQLTLDAIHWNSKNPNEESIIMPMDFTPDVEWRLNAPNEESEAG